MRSKGAAIADLTPAREVSSRSEADGRKLLEQFNRRHLEARGGSDDLSARIHAYEMAWHACRSLCPKSPPSTRETEATAEMYGLDKPETAEFGMR